MKNTRLGTAGRTYISGACELLPKWRIRYDSLRVDAMKFYIGHRGVGREVWVEVTWTFKKVMPY